MSISSRINEMSSHIEQAYDELQGLGADLTNVNKNIENISMVLDDIYDSMPQVSGEGTSLTLDDTRVGKIKSTLKGNTSQDGTPTPSSPIPVNVVSGDNEINICGKNLFDKSTIVASSMYRGNVGEIVTLGENSITFRYPIFKKTSDSITISASNTSVTFRVMLLDKDNKILSTTGYSSLPRTIDTSSCEYIAIFFDGTTITVNDNIQIEKGSSASTYEPYQGNTYNIDLPEGMELCKIGNYQDYIYKDSDKWYKYGAINKITLDGTQRIRITNWRASSTSVGWVYAYEVFNSVYIPATQIGDVKCNKLQASAFTPLFDKTIDNGIALYTDTDYGLAIRTSDTTLTSEASINAYLSSNPMIVYYPLATPTNTEITYQPLIDQLNLLEKAMSKDGQTNISQVNNDLPFIISASALKEWSV